MRAFYELKPNKILSYTYTLYPSYTIRFSGTSVNGVATQPVLSSSLFYIYDNAPIVQSRNFFNVYGSPLSSSGDPSGYALAIQEGVAGNSFSGNYAGMLSGTERLRRIYESSSFYKVQNWDDHFLERVPPWQLICIPSILYGSEIKPGSVYMSGAFSQIGYEKHDDGYGGLISTIASQEGRVYYQHGMIGLGPDYGGSFIDFSISFSGTYKIPQNIYIIDIPKGEANFSTNTSYTQYDTGSMQQRLAITEPKTYPTTVGLYNEDYELVGVIKVATPLYHDEKTPLQIRAKLNF